MQLYLMRHGNAEPGTRHRPDAERALTPEGHVQVEQQARALAQLRPTWGSVVSSTYVRARQTRDVVARAVGLKTHQDAVLRPGCSLDDLEEVLQGFETPPLVVFHQPSIGQITFELTGGRVAIPPGTVIHIDVIQWRKNGGMLTAIYPPESLAVLGRAIR
ncbi:MAG: histidine phosphatase family protein [Bacteroidota bacterium]